MSAIWRAIERTTSGSTPNDPPPKTSPDSFSRTRSYFGCSTALLLGGLSGSDSGAPRPPAGAEARSAPTRLSGVRRRSGADLEAREPGDGHALLVQQLLHALLAVLDRRLLEQDDVLEEAVDPALDDAGQRALGLALLAGRGLGDAALVLDRVARNLVTVHVQRAHRRDLHGRAARGVDVRAFELDEHADLRGQVAAALVHVRRDLAVEASDRAELDLLADDGRGGLEVVGDGRAVGERLGEQCVAVGDAGLGDVGDDVRGELLELLVLGDKVGLAPQLDERALGGGDDAVRRRTLTGLLVDL